MMAKEDIALLRRNLRYGNYLKCLPVKWDSINTRIVVKPQRQQRHVITMLVVHFLATLCRLYSIALHPANILHRSEATFGAMIYTMSFLIRFDIPVDQGAVEVMNFVMISINSGNSKLIHDVTIINIPNP